MYNRDGIRQYLHHEKYSSAPGTFRVVDIGCPSHCATCFTKGYAEVTVDIAAPAEACHINRPSLYLDLDNPGTWGELRKYVKHHGKFSHAICTHAMEDLVSDPRRNDRVQRTAYRLAGSLAHHRSAAHLQDGARDVCR